MPRNKTTHTRQNHKGAKKSTRQTYQDKTTTFDLITRMSVKTEFNKPRVLEHISKNNFEKFFKLDSECRILELQNDRVKLKKLVGLLAEDGSRGLVDPNKIIEIYADRNMLEVINIMGRFRKL